MKEIDGYVLSEDDIDKILDFIEDDCLYFLVDEIKNLVQNYPLSTIDGDLVRQIINEKLEN